MKKMVLIVTIIFSFNVVVLPAFYSAPVWWNPLSWFEDEDEQGPVWYNPLSWTRSGKKQKTEKSKAKPVEKKIHKETKKIEKEEEKKSSPTTQKSEKKESGSTTQKSE